MRPQAPLSHFKEATKARKDKNREVGGRSLSDSKEEGGGSVSTQSRLTFLSRLCAHSLGFFPTQLPGPNHLGPYPKVIFVCPPAFRVGQNVMKTNRLRTYLPEHVSLKHGLQNVPPSHPRSCLLVWPSIRTTQVKGHLVIFEYYFA